MERFAAAYFLLVVIHFFSDWLFQSEAEAMRKSKCAETRSRHCAVYTAFFIPYLAVMTGHVGCVIFMSFWIFWTHWIEDTYIPVMLWAKYLRKAKEFSTTYFDPASAKLLTSDEERFKAFVAAPLGLILAIAIDQIIHIVTLAPIAWFMTHH